MNSRRPTPVVPGDRAEYRPPTATLPKGYHARPFEERDREPWVAERNIWYGPMEQGGAEDWRIWESMSPDDSLLRLIVEDESGRIAARANATAHVQLEKPPLH